MDNDKKIYKITKLGPVQNPYHINSNFGESMPYHTGFFVEDPKVGERFTLYGISDHPGDRGISTSAVVKIIDEKTFETLNSVYSYEPYNK